MKVEVKIVNCRLQSWHHAVQSHKERWLEQQEVFVQMYLPAVRAQVEAFSDGQNTLAILDKPWPVLDAPHTDTHPGSGNRFCFGLLDASLR